MSHTSPQVTLSVRIPPKVRAQLDKLSDATGRTKSYLAAEAIEGYLAIQTWQVEAINQAVQKANGETASFMSHSQVKDLIDSWDVEDKKE